MSMKYLTSLVIFLAGVSFVFTETIVEVAQKEKLRREALAKEGKKSRVFTNDDIANLKSTLAMESTSSTELDEPAPSTAESQQNSTERAEKGENEERIKQLKGEIEKLKQEIGQDREAAASGGTYHTRNIGSQYRSLRESQSLLKELEEELAELEKKE